jgi:hypothetical protein
MQIAQTYIYACVCVCVYTHTHTHTHIVRQKAFDSDDMLTHVTFLDPGNVTDRNRSRALKKSARQESSRIANRHLSTTCRYCQIPAPLFPCNVCDFASLFCTQILACWPLACFFIFHTKSHAKLIYYATIFTISLQLLLRVSGIYCNG